MKNDEMKRLLIAGAGGFGSEVEGWLKTRGVSASGWLDDTPPHDNKRVPINAYEYIEGDQVIVAVGDCAGREAVVLRLRDRGAVFHGMLLHIGPHTHRIGGGCVTCPFSAISAQAQVGNFVHINLHTTVGHHVTVGDYCTLSSHVDLCGNVTVGKRVFFGSGARVLPNITIGDDAVIGAGSVVVRDVPAGAHVFGVPAVTL